MKVFVPPIDIGDDEGFDENDLFGRQKIGDGLTSLVSKITDPMVIAVDGQWGSGKTTFLRMWAGELRKAGFPVVIFDSFEHDYLPDAFTAIAGQIVSIVEDEEKSGQPKAKEFVKKATGVGKIILRGALRIGTKAATLGVMTTDELGGVANDISKEISKDLSEWEDKYLGELLTKQKEELALIDSFKKALKELPELLSKNESGCRAKPLIFIVDELDRCRPDFALEILERIKHFFSVENIHFVLGVSITQMAESVKLMYGSGIDANAYLEKFIHLRVVMSFAKLHNEDYQSKRYIGYLINRHNISQECYEKVRYYTEFTTFVAERKSFGLRTLERITSKWVLSIAVSSGLKGAFDAIVVGLVIIFITEPKLYIKLRHGEAEYSMVAEALGLDTSQERWPIDYTRKMWMYVLNEEVGDEAVNSIKRSLFDYSWSREDIVPKIIENVIETYTIL